MPKRIQRRRERGWRIPEGAVYVGHGSTWGNPWCIGGLLRTEAGDGPSWRHQEFIITPALAVAIYREAFAPDQPEIIRDLAGRDLACWCPLEDEHGNRVPCHADVLLELANPGGPDA